MVYAFGLWSHTCSHEIMKCVFKRDCVRIPGSGGNLYDMNINKQRGKLKANQLCCGR